MAITVERADYGDPVQAGAIARLMEEYALDPMGGGKPLPEGVAERLAAELARRPQALTLLAYARGEAAGLLNAFEGFSTFAGRPLLNLHDVVVARRFRGQGISRLLLAEAERIARERGCCKITLEVLEGNQAARAAYEKAGFGAYVLDPTAGRALFWQKPL
ncbi:GNAT family N-acetyltransferase [Roseomonas gilardii subsp. gilardii]|uniref:GNAT family N-acetyltransferase n=1 Tax=Roseomonas gilardii TaxID=257708 RepID=UPI001FF867E2|nr:GNAT family N-acetyltransferase [Roseomonas gilardii]UPG72089.1 GNAT family N-acetyltransferase [Roseomonas gilardii subsp. gilardii]